MNLNSFVRSALKEKSSTLLIAAVSILTLLIYTALYFGGDKKAGEAVLKLVLFFGSLPIWYEIVREMFRKNFGVDLIAGVALFSTFYFGQYLTGMIILLMLSGGETLESYAMLRARRDLSALLSRAPKIAHLKKSEEIEDLPIEEIQVGDKVLVKPGEVMPVDGVVYEGRTYVDESTLSGESEPVQKENGAQVFSGTVNQQGTITVLVTKPAAESSYARIVKLVRAAERSRPPIVRLADKYSVYFTIITFVLAGGTLLFTHDTMRMLAVLVVATPCPLILATPIALISGMSKITGHGVIVKNGGALEQLAAVKSFVFDKTGTLTLGTPEVEKIFSYEHDENEIIRLATSLDQLSAHVLSSSLARAAKTRGLKLSFPVDFKEDFGDGVRGKIDGQEYIFGRLSYLRKTIGSISPEVEENYERIRHDGKSVVYLGNNKKVLGYVVLDDVLRADSRVLFDGLKEEGISRILLLSGDKKSAVDRIGQSLGLSEIYSECLPEDKMRILKDLPAEARPVAMVGDGINDAPALAQADIGIALAGKGQTATSDSADIVVIGEGIARIKDAYHMAKKTLMVAKQGILIGIGLSILAMIFGSLGFITPIYGALLQEVIDIVVIINALRVARIVSI